MQHGPCSHLRQSRRQRQRRCTEIQRDFRGKNGHDHFDNEWDGDPSSDQAGEQHQSAHDFQPADESGCVRFFIVPAAEGKPVWLWSWAPKLAAAGAFVVIAFLLFHGWSSYQQTQTFAELADLHVTTLASATPVDIVSTDRHTVKPSFQGKLPFTFNLPELGDTPLTLEGGRMSYLGQSPGAQLIYKIGNHRISVFIFQNRLDRRFALSDGRSRRMTFNVEAWTEVDLRYFVMGDADPNDIHELSELLMTASRS